MSMAWSKSRPVINNNSRALSKLAVSLSPGVITGETFAMSPSNNGDSKRALRARIQLRLPRRVFISPLWARYR